MGISFTGLFPYYQKFLSVFDIATSRERVRACECVSRGAGQVYIGIQLLSSVEYVFVSVCVHAVSVCACVCADESLEEWEGNRRTPRCSSSLCTYSITPFAFPKLGLVVGTVRSQMRFWGLDTVSGRQCFSVRN